MLYGVFGGDNPALHAEGRGGAILLGHAVRAGELFPVLSSGQVDAGADHVGGADEFKRVCRVETGRTLW